MDQYLEEGMLAELVEIFVRSARQRLVTLDEAVAGASWSLVAAHAHALIGSAANCGARRLAASARALELAALGAPSACPSLLAALRGALEAAERALYDVVASVGGRPEEPAGAASPQGGSPCGPDYPNRRISSAEPAA